MIDRLHYATPNPAGGWEAACGRDSVFLTPRTDVVECHHCKRWLKKSARAASEERARLQYERIASEGMA